MTKDLFPYRQVQLVLVTHSGERIEIEADVERMLYVDVEADGVCIHNHARRWNDLDPVERQSARRFMALVSGGLPMLGVPQGS
ncbi:hypothetical protein [Nitratidesulfovibrio vulgaris]|jgi:hypothetical protein|nr:hypothetical protein [Nitratidesulfovibrio vulgaris]ADP86969.1 hypothetical protein Deval_1818 [Nitratidesulfovibrio vulgaris RCH1]WCB45024.1 hypothetical protein PH214_07925 [Nitratidesulfovibrio vulgaris]GEB79205.1 hypothetical protein DDE01_06200 [Desulfovibrio desulfuricans]HBW15905.1 hypothetical protein [Desulfovibrio sp.]